MKTSNKIIASVFAALLLAPSLNLTKANSAVRYEEIDVLFQETLNGILGYTRLIGNFETVNLTYETHRKTPVYFSVYRVEEGDGWMQSLSMKVIVQQDYEIDEIAYAEHFEFLGYTVHYSEMKKADSSTEPTLYAYKANGFIDTGAERYVMEYAEFGIEDNYHFAEYLQETLKQK